MSLYCKVVNTGKGFITAQDRYAFDIAGHSNDTWVVQDNVSGQRWIDEQRADQYADKAAAQTAVDAAILGQLYPDDYSVVELQGQQIVDTLP